MKPPAMVNTYHNKNYVTSQYNVDVRTPDDIVLISIDCLRYDAISYSNSNKWLSEHNALNYRNTPNLDELARENAFYENATSTSSYTPPSHTSMLTGLYPKDHGVKTFFNKLPSDITTLAELMKESGYKTKAWVENQALKKLDITRGFDQVICPYLDSDVDLFKFMDDIHDDEDPVFLFVHLFDVHKPYGYIGGGVERSDYNKDYLQFLEHNLPQRLELTELVDEARIESRQTIDNYADLTDSLKEYAHYWSIDYLIRDRLRGFEDINEFEYLIKLYLRGIERFDKGYFGDFINKVYSVVSNNNLIIITSDHGEAVCRWRDRHDFMNSYNVSEQAVRIPLIIDFPENEFDFDIKKQVNHVDIIPTFLDLGFNFENNAYSESLLDLETKPPNKRDIFHESYYYEDGYDFFGNEPNELEGGISEISIRSYPLKLTYSLADTHNPNVGLYNLDIDPYEDRNLIDDDPEETRLATMRSKLDSYLDDVDSFITFDENFDDNSDLKDHLRSLGYLN